MTSRTTGLNSKTRNAVTNTTEEISSLVKGVGGLAAVVAMGEGGIERQEAAGQAELCMSDVLPTQGIEEVRKMIETAGGSIGDHVPKDTMFRNVKLPPGWKKRATDHSMWSDLIDDKGRKRAGIFYKATFYDRSARISPVRRFNIDPYSSEITDEGSLTVKLTDSCGEVTNSVSGTVSLLDDARSREYKLRDRLVEEMKTWLTENYPDWESSEAYWD